MAAATSGDVDGLIRLLAEDAVAWGDGGGKRAAARRSVVGHLTLARFFAGITRLGRQQGATARLVRESKSRSAKVYSSRKSSRIRLRCLSDVAGSCQAVERLSDPRSENLRFALVCDDVHRIVMAPEAS